MIDQPQDPLFYSARRSVVLAALARDGMVQVSQLVQELGVTPVTVRRDLARLEEEGLLERVHGGAVAVALSADTGPVTTEVHDVDSRSRGIVAMVPSLGYYWSTVVRGMEQEANRRGYRLLPRSGSYQLQDERSLLSRVVGIDGVHGLIVAPNVDKPHVDDVIQWLAGCGVPSVLAEREALLLPEGTPVESVATDHALGAKLAVRYLHSLGHTRIGLLHVPTTPTSRKLVDGWRAACDELGLTPDQHFEHPLPVRTIPEYPAAVDAALDHAIQRRATALLVHPDQEAMAVVDLALDRGISVPGDLSVMAYDDEVADLYTPALTAVSPPRVELGAAAVDLLIRRIAEPQRPVHRITLNPVIRVRESTAPPSGARPTEP